MRRSGFTTIELVIAIVIIGLIAAIGFPKIHRTLDKTNVRSARTSIGTFAAMARAAAVQRGCRAVLHFVSTAPSSAWVTVCPRYTPGVGTVDTIALNDVTARFNVTMTATRDSVQYDPRGLSMDNVSTPTIVRFTGKIDSNTDSVQINTVGKVVR